MIKELSNYGISRVVASRKTDVYLNVESDTLAYLSYVMDIDPNVDRLKMQATTFAKNFKDQGAYDFGKLWNVPSDMVISCLEELYIYSFFKAYYSIVCKRTCFSGTEYNGGYSFWGHSQLFYLASSESISWRRQGVDVTVKFEMGSESYQKAKFALILKQFDFLAKNIPAYKELGSYVFLIDYLENRFSALKENYYAKRAEGEPAILTDKDNFLESFNTKELNAEMSDKGKVAIVHLRNKRASEYFNDIDKIPLLNTFWKNNKVINFIEVNSGYPVEYNESFFWCIANFVTIKESESTNKEINRYYKSLILTEKQNVFLRSEVYTVTGIKGGFQVHDDGRNRAKPFGGMPFKDLLNELQKLPDRLSVLDDIYEQIEEIVRKYELDIELKIKEDKKKKPEGK